MSQNAAVRKGVEREKMGGACDDAGCGKGAAFYSLVALCSRREKPPYASRVKIGRSGPGALNYSDASS